MGPRFVPEELAASYPCPAADGRGVEIVRGGEPLGQEGGSRDLPVHPDQGAVGFAGKQSLADGPDDRRVDAAAQDRQQQRGGDRRAEFRDKVLHGSPSSRKMEQVHCDVDDLDPREGEQHAAQPVDEEVAAQERTGAQRPEMHPAEGQGDERDDDEGVEDDGA